MNLAWQWHDDSTAAVSNVQLNTVAPNSKDKTNHLSSGVSPLKIAEGNLGENREKFVLFKTILSARKHHKWMQQSILNTVIPRRRLLLQVSSRERAAICCITIVPPLPKEPWLVNTDWNIYSEKRFKQIYVFQGGPFSSFLTELDMT